MLNIRCNKQTYFHYGIHNSSQRFLCSVGPNPLRTLCLSHVVDDRRRPQVLQVVSKAVFPWHPNLTLPLTAKPTGSIRFTSHKYAWRRRDRSSSQHRAEAHGGGMAAGGRGRPASLGLCTMLGGEGARPRATQRSVKREMRRLFLRRERMREGE